jgi:hypothetical protein
MANTIKTDYPNSGFERNNRCQYGSNLCVCVCVCVYVLCLCKRDISNTFELNNGPHSLLFSVPRDWTRRTPTCSVLSCEG